MNAGEFLTRATVWLALSAYTLSVLVRQRSEARARQISAAGCALFLAHVACAFAYFHHWSHSAAYAETARRTAALAGVAWGGGLYFNYAFAIAWLLVVIGWRKLSRGVWWSWRGFAFFMIANGAVIFVQGPLRWYGMVLCVALAFVHARDLSRGPHGTPSTQP